MCTLTDTVALIATVLQVKPVAIHHNKFHQLLHVKHHSYVAGYVATVHDKLLTFCKNAITHGHCEALTFTKYVDN